MTLRRRILVVDDEESVRTSIGKILQFHGFSVVSACDLTDAIDKLAAESFDVVLTDLRMSGPEDGLLLIERVRKTYPNTVTLLMSAHANLVGGTASLRLSSDEVISKPTDIPTLLRKINDRLTASLSSSARAERVSTARPL
jgi:DNA-binding NtrC family response regulator